MKLPIQDVVSDEHLKAIGLVIVEWAGIENMLLYMLCNLAIPDAKKYEDYLPGLILSTGMGHRIMLGLMRAIVEVRFPKDLKQFEKIQDGLEKSADLRDIFAHQSFHVGKKTGSVKATKMKSVGGLKTIQRDFTAEEITNIAHEMQSRAVALADFLKFHGLWRTHTMMLQARDELARPPRTKKPRSRPDEES